ncbi:tigger transposable element-derived protein 1-like isoform X2 [Narcine bancroftii]|uniref:tigger transposable element-derived protein 1-like isoform X2 n=1 Tax=Narcine bancroftii TaxID=1343680 RepID=UPI003831603A
MTSKRKNPSPTDGPGKKSRKVLNLELKMKDKEKIREAVKGSASMKSVIITKHRQGPIHEMEKLLMLWMEDQIQNCVPLNLPTIQAKARSLFEILKEQAGEDYTENFTASHGWFDRFKRRYSLHKVRVTGADEKFVESLDELIHEERYLPEQIFNVDETGLFWKRLPKRTYIHQEAKTMPGFKAFNDRVTLLLGGNVAGFKLKPFLIYHSENPCAFKNINKHTLPVHYRSNLRSCMTQTLFEDWFVNCFIPSVREYCLENSIPFKILLILDNAPAHPPHLDDLHPDVKVIYLPLSTTSIIQPMDQGAIATFKAYYLQSTFAQARAVTNNEVSLRDFWKHYNILECIKNITAAWEDVTKTCMNGIWKKCLKRYVHTFKGFNKEDALDEIREKIVKLAKTLELEVKVEDVEELLDLESKELTDEELIEIEEERIAEKERRKKEEEEPQRNFTVKGLANVFSQVNKALADLESMDQNVERFTKVDRQIQEALNCYRQIYEEKKKQTIQTNLSLFFKHVTPPTTPCPSTQRDEDYDEPQPSTSLQVPEVKIEDAIIMVEIK